MTLEELTEAVRGKVGEDSGLDAVVRFTLDDGVILIDGRAAPNTVSNEDGEADCTLTMSSADFEEMMSGDLDPTMAFMSGRLQVDGDMGVAMRLANVI